MNAEQIRGYRKLSDEELERLRDSYAEEQAALEQWASNGFSSGFEMEGDIDA